MTSSNREIRRKRQHASKHRRGRDWKGRLPYEFQNDFNRSKLDSEPTWSGQYLHRYGNRHPEGRTRNPSRFSIVEGIRWVMIYTVLLLVQADSAIGSSRDSHDKPPDICRVQTYLIDHAGQSTLLRYKRAPAPQVADSSSAAASSAAAASPGSSGTRSSSVPRSPPTSPSSLSPIASASPSSSRSASTVPSTSSTATSAPASSSVSPSTTTTSSTSSSNTSTSRTATTTTTITVVSSSSTTTTSSEAPAPASPAPTSPRTSTSITTSKSGTSSSSAQFAAPANTTSMTTDGNVTGYIYGPASSGAVRSIAHPWEFAVHVMSCFRLRLFHGKGSEMSGSELDSVASRMGPSWLRWWSGTKSVDAKLKLEGMLEEFGVAVQDWKSKHDELEELRTLKMQIGLVGYEKLLVKQQRWSFINGWFVWKKPDTELESGEKEMEINDKRSLDFNQMEFNLAWAS
ncbi:hypothetical protein BJ742DRAFT_775351 [Cladochytrium replicatum]|nr:hypothetical protein BJ742DRAFT_775351 [Cladochytrium replicatum]